MGNFEEAEKFYLASWPGGLEFKDERIIINCLVGLAEISLQYQQVETALLRLAVADTYATTTKTSRNQSEQQRFKCLLDRVREVLGDTEFKIQWQAASILTPAQVI
jgi:hypothetical protein